MSDLAIEDILIFEGRNYKPTSGSSGPQFNIEECPEPSCGKTSWKVYMGEENSLGNCFSCGARFNLFKFCGAILRSKGGAGTNHDVGRYLDTVRKAMGFRPKRVIAVKVATEEGDFELPMSMALPDAMGKNHEYLEKRGIDGETAAAFQLRFSMFGYHAYKNDKGEEIKQSFANRIIIPVHNLDGKCVTFQGRDVTGFSETRYKFAGGLPGTARYLYNGHVAHAMRAKHVLMNEGPTDVMKAGIALKQAADLASIVPVGSFGMNMSKTKEGDDQIAAFSRLQKSGLEIVTIMWDGEAEAFEAALKAGEDLLKIGLRVRIAILPKPTDIEKANGVKSLDPGSVDASVIQRCVREAIELNRLSVMRLRMNNPYLSR